MNLALLLEIINLAASIIKSQTSGRVDDRIDEGLAIARIVAAGREAYEGTTGQPLDEATIRKQDQV